jgi:hypothetical protein
MAIQKREHARESPGEVERESHIGSNRYGGSDEFSALVRNDMGL